MVLEFFFWWYGPGWLDTIKRVWHRVVATTQIFSVPILLLTLFSPWKRVVSESDGSLDMILRTAVDNLVSRAVGFVVRLVAIIVSFGMTTVALVVGVLIIVLWPLLPIAAVASLVMTVVGGLVK